MMPDREKVISCLSDLEQIMITRQEICPREELQYWIELQEGVADALALLKGKELPTELKQKMWNALYAIEDEYEKKFVGTEEHLDWFAVYRPWLQKGFDIAIKTIADWEGR